jgi:hypothetical protein
MAHSRGNLEFPRPVSTPANLPVKCCLNSVSGSVRQRLLNLYADLKSGKRLMDRKTARVLFMTYEHEGFHAEVPRFFILNTVTSLIELSRLCCTCSYDVPVPAHFRPRHSQFLYSTCCLATGMRSTQASTSHPMAWSSGLDRKPSLSDTTIWKQMTLQFLTVPNMRWGGIMNILSGNWLYQSSRYPGDPLPTGSFSPIGRTLT